MDREKIKTEVWKTVQELNQLWTSRNQHDQLANYFHRDMVAISPATRQRIEAGMPA